MRHRSDHQEALCGESCLLEFTHLACVTWEFSFATTFKFALPFFVVSVKGNVHFILVHTGEVGPTEREVVEEVGCTGLAGDVLDFIQW